MKWIFEPPSKNPSAFVDGGRLVFGKYGKPYTGGQLIGIWNRANLKSKIEHINLYNAMRQSFACQRLNDGFQLSEVQAVLGHTTPMMTQKYAQYAVDKLGGIIKGKKPVHNSFILRVDGETIERKRGKWSGREDLNFAPSPRTALFSMSYKNK